MVTCDLCSKEFKTTQGLKGHKTFKHSNGSSGNGSATNPVAEQELGELLDRLEKLEITIGLTEESNIDGLPDGAGKSLIQQLAQFGEQLSELTQWVDQLGEQLEHTRANNEMVDSLKVEYNEQLEQLSRKWDNLYRQIGNIVNRNSNLINKGFSVTEESVKTVNKQMDEIKERVGKLEGRQQPESLLEKQSNDRLNLIEQKLTSLTKELSVVKNLAIRQPTGKWVLYVLKDRMEHKFKEYKSPDGLIKPHRCSRDLLFGDRWIDLAEPED